MQSHLWGVKNLNTSFTKAKWRTLTSEKAKEAYEAGLSFEKLEGQDAGTIEIVTNHLTENVASGWLKTSSYQFQRYTSKMPKQHMNLAQHSQIFIIMVILIEMYSRY
jgi:hypothetical protein